MLSVLRTRICCRELSDCGLKFGVQASGAPSSAERPSSYTGNATPIGQQQRLRTMRSTPNVRATVRARVLALVDQFTADVQESSQAERARIMAAFRQGDEDTIKPALDPDWDRHAFLERVGADSHITE